MSLLRSARSLAGRPASERWLLLEAGARLVGLRLYLALIGQRRQLALYGRGVPAEQGEALRASLQLSDEQRRLAKSLAWAIGRAERVLPLSVNCLPQALVGRRMLRDRGIASVMFFGVEHGKHMNAADTHAWLMAGDVPVTGHVLRPGYLAFAAFPPLDAEMGA